MVNGNNHLNNHSALILLWYGGSQLHYDNLTYKAVKLLNNIDIM
jgi:hypothetical protein